MKNSAKAVVLGIAVAVLVASGIAVWNHGRNEYWWGTSDAQQRLFDDPMAASDLSGLSMVREDVAGPVGFLGKARGAFVHRWYDHGGRPEQVLAELGALAAANGWTQQVELCDDTAWVGRKNVGGPVEAHLIIHLEGLQGETTTASGSQGVRVSLTY